jgi:hypothetical protein
LPEIHGDSFQQVFHILVYNAPNELRSQRPMIGQQSAFYIG